MFAVAQDTPKEGYHSVEAVADSGAEESVVPPNVLPFEIHASARSKVGGKYKAADGTRIPNLGPQRVRVRNDIPYRWFRAPLDCGTTVGRRW